MRGRFLGVSPVGFHTKQNLWHGSGIAQAVNEVGGSKGP